MSSQRTVAVHLPAASVPSPTPWTISYAGAHGILVQDARGRDILWLSSPFALERLPANAARIVEAVNELGIVEALMNLEGAEEDAALRAGVPLPVPAPPAATGSGGVSESLSPSAVGVGEDGA